MNDPKIGQPFNSAPATGEVEILSTDTSEVSGTPPVWPVAVFAALAAVAFGVLFQSSPTVNEEPIERQETPAPTTIPSTTTTTITKVIEANHPYRDSVRNAMIQNCDRQRVKGLKYEAFIEYERCLLAIENDLDEICYLSLRAQFTRPDEDMLSEACGIDTEPSRPIS